MLCQTLYLLIFLCDFSIKVAGVQTSRDDLAIDFTSDALEKKIKMFFDISLSDEYIKKTFSINDTRDYSIKTARTKEYNHNSIINYLFRPFDTRKIYYDASVVSWPRYDILKSMLTDNISIISGRSSTKIAIHYLVSNLISDVKSGEYSKGSHQFPLFIIDNLSNTKILNIKPAILLDFSERYAVLNANNTNIGNFIIYYIYSILYSDYYRNKFKEQLKSDFPRIPFVNTKEEFERLVELGSQLTKLHLLEEVIPIQGVADFATKGSNIVEKVVYKDGSLYINKDQYFSNISQPIWEFTIGGYQVLDKWLKSRKGRVLSQEEVEHLQTVARSLSHTLDVMKKIDEVVIEGVSF